MGMSLDQVSGGSDGDDDAGPAVWAESCPDVLGDGLGGALGEVEEKLPAHPEDPPQEAGHGEDEVAMQHPLDHWPQGAMLRGEAREPDSQQLLEVLLDQTGYGRGPASRCRTPAGAG